MKSGYRQTWNRLAALLAIPQPEAGQVIRRIRIMELDIMMPLKLVAFLLLTRSVYFPVWTTTLGKDVLHASPEVAQSLLWLYLLVTVIMAAIMFVGQHLPLVTLQWIAIAGSIVDAAFLGIITLVTGGYDSPVFWLFLGLVIRNAVSVPQGLWQHALNLFASLVYAVSAFKGAAVAEKFPDATQELLGLTPLEKVGEPLIVRLLVLWLTAACCHAVQIMIERYRLAAEESREFATRESQLRSAGRLAAQIAHQIKNPLAIINNTAFSLRRGLRDAPPEVHQQIEIIQEEVARSDQIITQLMGYAQLSEGRVEKLSVIEELDRAILEVFPPAMDTGVGVARQYEGEFPPLMMQRRHLGEILANLLQNARDALGDRGHILVQAGCRRDQSIEITITDDGPGVPPDKREQIFEAYYTTKARGTGLGLAIVKQNMELYGGTVQLESELGKGAKFILLFPAKALMKLGK